MQLPKLETPKFNVNNNLPSIPIPRLNPPRVPTIYGITKPKVDVMFDMYDPDELNSFADVFWRFIENSWDGSVTEALGESFMGTLDVIKGTWKPLTLKLHEEGWKGLSDGQAWAQLGINSLISIGETLDLFANPVKGAILDGGWEGFKKGSIGRETYEFDTGNLLLDIGAEVVVDPLNVITLGGAGITKALGKAGINATDNVIQEIGEKAFKKSVKAFSTAYTGNFDEAVNTVLKRRFVKNLPTKTKDLLKETLTHNTNLKLIANVNKITHGAEVIDKQLMRASMAYIPTLVKSVGVRGLHYIDNQILRHAEKYIPEDGHITTVTLLQAGDDIGKTIDSLNNIPEIKISGLSKRLVLRKQAKRDFDVIKQIIIDNAGDLNKTLQELEKFAKSTGVSFSEYSSIIRQLDEAQRIKQVSRLRNQLDAIDNTVREAREKFLEGQLAIQRSQRAGIIVNKISEDFVGFTNIHKEANALKGLKELHEDLTNKIYKGFGDLANTVDDYKLKHIAYEVSDIVNYVLRDLDAMVVNKMFDEVDDYNMIYSVFQEVYNVVDNVVDDVKVKREVFKRINEVIKPSIDDVANYITDNTKLKGLDADLINYRATLMELLEPHITNKYIGDKIRKLYNQIKNSNSESGFKSFLNKPLNEQYRWTYDKTIEIAEALSELDQTDILKELNELADTRLAMNDHNVFEQLTLKYSSSVDDLTDEAVSKLHVLEDIDINYDVKTDERLNSFKNLLEYFNDVPTVDNEFLTRLHKETYDNIRSAIKEITGDQSLSNRELIIKVNELADDLDHFIKTYEKAYAFESTGIQRGIPEALIEEAIKKTLEHYPNLRVLLEKYVEGSLKRPLIEMSITHNNAVLMFHHAIYAELAKTNKSKFFKEAFRPVADTVSGDPILDALKELSDRIRIEDYNFDELINMKRGRIRYALKMSQAESSFLLYNVEGLDAIFKNQFYYLEAVKKIISNPMFSIEDKHRASSIMVRLEDLKLTRDLYQKVLNGNFRDTTRIGILDTLENMRNYSLDKALENPKYLKDEILRYAELNPRSNLNKQKYSLEKYVKNNKDEIAKFAETNYSDILEDIKNELPMSNETITHDQLSHDARYDIIVTKFLAEKEGINLGVNPIIVDIETTGLNAGSDEIMQIAWMLPDGTIKSYNIRPDKGLVPSIDFMYKATGEFQGTTEELVEAFNTKFATNAVEEHIALEEFFNDFVTTRNADPDNIGATFVAHNLDGFDMEFIRKRSVANDVNTHSIFSVKNKDFVYEVDTLQEMYKKDDVFFLTREEKLELNKIIDEHLHALDTSVTSDLHLELRKNKILEEGVIKREIRTTPSTLLMSEVQALHDTVMGLSKPSMVDGMIQDTVKLNDPDMQHILDLTTQLNLYSTRVYDTLNGISSLNRKFGYQYISKAELDEMGMNITQFLNKQNIDFQEGKLIRMQSVAATKDIDVDKVLNYYPHLADTQQPKSVLDRLKGPIRRMEQLRNSIKDSDLVRKLYEVNWSSAEKYFKEFKDLYIKSTPGTTHTAAKILEFSAFDARTGLAQLKYMYDRVNAVYPEYIENLDHKNSLLLQVLKNEETLFTELNTNLFRNNDLNKYMSINHVDEHSPMIEKGLDIVKQAESLEEMLNLLDETKLHNARVFQKFGLLKDTLQDFQAFIQNVDDKYWKAHTSNNPYESGVEKVVEIIKDLKRYQDEVNSKRIDMLQRMEPDHMASYLWNKSKGVLIIDLESAYRNPIYENGLFANIEKYTDIKGVEVWQDDNTLILYLTDEFDVNAKYSNFNLPELDLYTGGKTKEIEMYENARKRLIDKIPEASGTSFEIMNKSKYYDLIDRLPKDVKENIIDFSTLNSHHKFDGLNFNHSVYGTTASRRQWLDYIYNNPFKDLYYTAQEAAKISDSQTRYVHSLTNHGMNLGSDYMRQFSDEDIFNTIKDNKHLRIGALVEDKKRGFMFKEFRVHKVSDIKRLRELNAVILPHHLLKTSLSMINNDGITNGFVKFFDKYIVGAYKIGVLSSSGYLLRNLYDSNYKNIVSEGPGIVKITLKTRQLYQEYTTIIQEIIENYGHLNPRTIGRYFEEINATSLDIEMFNLIDEFIQDGPSAGLSKVMEDKIGNVYKRLQNKSEYRSILKWQDVRDYILNDGVIDKNYPAEILDELERLSGEYEYYHKGFAMMQHTKHSELKLDHIVHYLKHPDEIPDHLRKEFNRIKKYEPASKITQKIDKLVFENPWSRSIMNFNTHQEQIFRLSNYLHEVLVNGETTSKAIYSVVENHFDTLHKTYHQQLLEMLFPFSVFRLNNIRFWANAIEEHPAHGKAVFDFLQGQIEPDYSEWDLANRRSLQYHILNGSIIIDDETGLNVKLSPSVLDAFQALYAPGELVKGSLVPIIKNPFEIAMMEKEDWMDEEYFEKMKRNKVISMLPMGVHNIRQQSRVRDYERTGSVAPLVMPSMFGSTNLPKPYDPKMYPRYKKYYGHNTFSYYTTYPKTIYAERPGAYYRAKYSDMRDIMWSPLLSRRVNRGFQKREDIYTASGKNKLNLMMFPQRPGDGKYMLNNIWR